LTDELEKENISIMNKNVLRYGIKRSVDREGADRMKINLGKIQWGPPDSIPKRRPVYGTMPRER
jgi:hypothetical protein